MRPPGCALAAAAGFLYLTFVRAAVNDYGIPIEIKVWDSGRTPLAHMVDVTNSFGLRVLAEHNFLNDNNIAFSPYGLMGILVALYEGVDGESSYQIQRSMQLPWNRNVMRIGFRDIHRTLKTYFVPEEGFLAGLALNNDNVTFNNGYKKILRFYGFDLENDQLPTLAPNNSSSVNETTTNTSSATTSTTQSASTQAREEITTDPNTENIITSTRSPSSAPKVESTTTFVPMTKEYEASKTTVTESSSPSENTEQTTTTMSTVAVESETTALPDENETLTPTFSSASTAALTNEPTVNNEVEVIQVTKEIPYTPETATITNESTMSESVSSTATSQMPQSSDMTSSTDISTLADVTVAFGNESMLETLERRKKSIVDFIFNNPPYVDDYLFYRSYDIPIPESSSGFGIEMFLVNGLRNIQVSYMHYDTVLEHAYLPHLEASAVRLPLDSDRYYLLVVLPSQVGTPDLGRLMARMARESDLSDVYSALRPKRVRVTVPSFTVKGHVSLTTDLQKLGIRDVFEPRQRDFTPMTQQPGAYVRSIEQAVSVAIREYSPAAANQSNNRYMANRQPVTFAATYPFLYFVMDSSIHVALMAGKMVDPLNNRIL